MGGVTNLVPNIQILHIESVDSMDSMVFRFCWVSWVGSVDMIEFEVGIWVGSVESMGSGC